MIGLLCPTRGRPEQFSRMCRSVHNTAAFKDKIRIRSASNGNDDYADTKLPLDLPTVYMWNLLANRVMGQHHDAKLFMLCADDVIFSTPSWDKAIIDHYNALENKIHVYTLQDSRDVDGTPHPIVTREYIEAMGYFIPPIFLHWFGDTWTVAIARANNCFTHMRDFSLVHEKPSDVGKPDETHLGIRRMGWHERDKCVNDTCHHFLEFEKQRLAKVMCHDK